MDRRTVLLGSLGLTLPAAAQTGQTPQTKSLVVKARTGELADTTLYTNSFAVLIGITYPKFPDNLQIPQANSDIDDLKALLVKSYGFLPENILVLKDPQATKKGIEKALASLADRKRVQATDRVLVYFSCHGQTIKTQDGGDQGFLIPVDAEIDLKDTANPVPYLSECIPMDSLWRYLESCPARHRLLIADACFAGLTVQSKAFPKPSAATLKGFLAVPALQAIAAGGKGEEALVLPGLRNSAFTHKLLEVLRQAAASGEIVATSLLGAQLKTSVPDLCLTRTGGKFKQTPQFGSRGTEGEWLFVPVNAAVAPVATTPETVPAAGGALSTSIRLELTGVPAGAKITLDGTQLTGNVFTDDIVEKSKSFEVGVIAAGFKPYLYTVVVPRGGNVVHAVTLEAKFIRLELTGVPTGARVTIDGSPLVGSIYTTDIEGNSKSVEISVSAKGYEPYTVLKTIPRGGTIIHPVVMTVMRKRTLTDYPSLRAYVESLRSIPAGMFQMGSKKGYKNEQPVRAVSLSAFRIGATPVTVAVWREYCDATGISMPSAQKWELLDDHPIKWVSYLDILGSNGRGGFCAWASDIAGMKLTLPTEAQWEYAARGGLAGQEYPWGNVYDDSKLWCSKVVMRNETAPVTRITNVYQNGYGLIDMVGNVNEWCMDWRATTYEGLQDDDPSGPESPDSANAKQRVVRGGSWREVRSSEPFRDDFRCASRNGDSPGNIDSQTGFRLVS
jgi:sulfatase modifying factor 1